MKTKGISPKAPPAGAELLTGFIRLHILHHAARGPVIGAWITKELAHHGYHVSPGTLYPMLRGMEQRGLLKSTAHREGRRGWHEYKATPVGRRALQNARKKLRELFHELIEETDEMEPAHDRPPRREKGRSERSL